MFKLVNIKLKKNLGTFESEDEALEALVEIIVEKTTREYRIVQKKA